MLLLALACFAAAELAYHVVVLLGSASFAIFWIPVGLITGALLSTEPKRWPSLMAAGAAGILLAGIGFNGHGWFAETVACGITLLEALAVAWLVRFRVREPFTLTRVTHVFQLALVCTVLSIVAGFLDALLLDLGRNELLLTAWRARSLAEIDGLMLAAPAAIALMQGPGVFSPGVPRGRRLEAAIAMVLAAVVLELIFGDI